MANFTQRELNRLVFETDSELLSRIQAVISILAARHPHDELVDLVQDAVDEALETCVAGF